MIVRSGGVELTTYVQGEGEPPLVLVHGYIGSHVDWDLVAPALASSRRVITYDHRGHGDSTNAGNAAAYTFDKLVDDLESVVDALGPGPVHLLGHSMGGVVSMRYALRHPDALASLVLMDTAAEPMGGLPSEAIDGLVAVGRTSGMAAAAEIMVAFAAELGDRALDDAAKARALAKFSLLDVEAVGAFGAELGCYPSMLGALAALELPTTVIVGENDTGLRGAADSLAATIPGAVLVVIPGAGHSPQEDAPEAWLAAVEGHLARASQ
ncbi:MAG TPA: alpha/beta hydrolase [Mycobacteriales bacterium]|nr:alpha/beta hydrolase [Mycobacteriales bacterium]